MVPLDETIIRPRMPECGIVIVTDRLTVVARFTKHAPYGKTNVNFPVDTHQRTKGADLRTLFGLSIPDPSAEIRDTRYEVPPFAEKHFPIF